MSAATVAGQSIDWATSMLVSKSGPFGVFSTGLSILTGWNPFSWNPDTYTAILCLVGVFAFLKNYMCQFRTWLEQHFTSQVYISRTDESYDMLSTWVASRGLQHSARSTVARVDGGRNDQEDKKKPLTFAPWNGSFFFLYKGSVVSYSTHLRDNGLQKEEEVVLGCFGRSSTILKTLLQECRVEYLGQIEDKTTIFESRGDAWMKMVSRETRPLSTVIVDEQKQLLVEDARDFLSTKTRKWFAQRALPYRRGYLLHGPPGTGKSSFSLSIAGELGLDVYIAHIHDASDQTLKSLFSKLPQRCVVLLEDIDAVGITRSSKGLQEAATTWAGTLSGLLNILDGVSSQEGRLLIMTTNHVENLDEALIRPGRVDLKAGFQLADANAIRRIFAFVFHQDTTEASTSRGHEVDPTLETMAKSFAARVPEHEFSPAEVISYLLQYKHSLAAAVENAEEWVAAMRKEKRDKVLK
ncbi:hypothetical protein RJ55_02584 [Drechmeria coniospora]|nr:hypothetical protein RJ55_02584 [Drechmeria coniospora]